MATEKRLIDANAFKVFLEGVRQDYIEENTFSSDFAANVIETVQDNYLDLAPTVYAVEVVHGQWIDMQEDESTEGMWRCSVCGSDRYFDIMTPTECGCYYCPNCGAKMDLKGE